MRGQRVVRADGRPVMPVAALARDHALEVRRVVPSRPDQNVAEIAMVTIAPHG